MHERYIRRCLELARLGAGSVSPNPMVGSVIVADDRIIGEGYHRHYGGPHAEVNAVTAVADEVLLRQATLYVNLEPCSHFGKTPPCSDLIIAKGIPRVVIGCRDPHVKVAGKGIEKLLAAGVDVVEGVLKAESEKLNEAFITSHRKGRPFIALKLAQTLDGKIATAAGASKWITGQEARTEVHRMRCRYDAVLTGSATVVADDSRLTVRHCAGRNPLRVVLDSRLSIPIGAGIFSEEAETIVFTTPALAESRKADKLAGQGVTVLAVGERDCGLDLADVLGELHRRRVLSVLVEGGGRLVSSFVKTGLADKLYLFVAPKLFGGDGLSSFAPLGVTSPELGVELDIEPPVFFGRDILFAAYIHMCRKIELP
ncbi:MAG: bifunctional diaminohydroxyphosphoribosylaminopyrimidine deaminase/5-amino-6-(5-phosphoribosylamino)uracil reductase RibD [Chlorobium sp.]|nr:bifunctional diaminohydroxyphosphoribosylaminopyrimidine deaminase/5-amino-6-(5-phosphoribosylamino)uracil reductase RibD [Chlorobiaceae bacterium]MCF8216410.1 bifunctional diaminohydroxyphosphoribosylaminopyrimidine deaminase/5-amino-6-(5-phosphoribosylamino)uracil reductase RibD [Chlorobium sp.]MCF8271313.1 bifunctional diaminohydroxyphosphoribosylaminopyrimidine deaminase/5-amino-6-(5-phosphoribosylamino)uracil reductase RibD [Chlorobium sp.]MCF8287687.1 bifunctional diaminohydroxyphosphor